MNGLLFSASGICWQVAIVTPYEATNQYVPALPGPGLLFRGDDGTTRFMSLDAEAVPSIDELRQKTNEELGSLARLAVTWQA